MSDPSDSDSVARAVERLRLAEASLARRRQTDCGPSETARAAMRLVYDSADAGKRVTPTDIAASLGISTPTATTILKRLHDGGLVSFERNPDDGRSKYVVPTDRTVDAEGIDPLADRVRALTRDLDADTAATVSALLDAITDAVDGECR
ncbi:MarR family winged helix-turn-helix transcriptional regulator [Microbacterium thalli]|uniref:MarR family transcriptional regulator n=1 Tax=Microbacterium thalli TaxID=3027921 RepID=A0ABT5SFG3_9MICO|nr:MarR family transcriptional regulator [Microbacterium thalli]MDD7928873.1 MarR family transcriptional regulator [Microbacterium thalli]MDD7961461.1 MarR family transcriptional regulator [Microbacterium thalli]MDN8547735.1 MarR family transcriptional regulator [Microbacterium thalli]